LIQLAPLFVRKISGPFLTPTGTRAIIPVVTITPHVMAVTATPAPSGAMGKDRIGHSRQEHQASQNNCRSFHSRILLPVKYEFAHNREQGPCQPAGFPYKVLNYLDFL
jgi:hypothetical protein